jgi:glutamine synthetase
MEAVDLLDRDAFFRDAFGEGFVDYMLRLKRHELDRFLSHVTDWEHTEYFEMY